MNILEEANKLTGGGERAQDYGHPREDFGRTAKMWSALLGCDVSTEQVGLCMIALKMSRQINKSKRDNLVDIAGYARTVEKLHEPTPIPSPTCAMDGMLDNVVYTNGAPAKVHTRDMNHQG